MKSRKRGQFDSEKLLSHVVEFLSRAIEYREAFTQADRLLAEGMAGVVKELEETEDMSKVDRIIVLAEKVQGLLMENKGSPWRR